MKTTYSISFLILIIWFILFLFVVLSRKWSEKSDKQEGFDQSRPYTIKTGDAVFDKFYMEVYEEIMEPAAIVEKEIDIIERMTQSTTESSRWLVVGSKSGILLNSLLKRHYKAFGVDITESTVVFAQEKYPSVSVKCGNAEKNQLLYQAGIFTHILLLNMSIYDYENKTELFKHCWEWLKPGNYLIVSLMITPAQSLIRSNQNDGYRYDSAIANNTLKEKFTDLATGHVRENERKLFLGTEQEILDAAKNVGFSIFGKMLLTREKHEENIYFLLK